MCDIPNNTTIPQLEEQFVFKIVDSEANLNFNHNSADYGGALVVENSTVHMVWYGTNGIEFYDDRAMTSGGAMEIIYISTNISVKFTMNSAIFIYVWKH